MEWVELSHSLQPFDSGSYPTSVTSMAFTSNLRHLSAGTCMYPLHPKIHKCETLGTLPECHISKGVRHFSVRVGLRLYMCTAAPIANSQKPLDRPDACIMAIALSVVVQLNRSAFLFD